MEISLIIISSILIGYLIGSIPNAVIIGKVFFKKDVRDFGSKNAGGTNAGRVFGKKVGLIVIVLDIIKTIIPIYLVYFILLNTSLSQYEMQNIGYSLSGIFALIGHCFPIYTNFRGGKAVSSFAGIIIATNWLFIIIGLVLFMLILKIKKMVSLASITTSFVLAVCSFLIILLPNNFSMIIGKNDIFYSLLISVSALILIYRHKENIKRLINHEERKITWLK